MLVFTKLEDLDEINQARIEQHYQQEEMEKAERKQRVYQQIADKQIQQVIAAMMSVSDIGDRPKSRSIWYSWRQHQSDMGASIISENAANVLDDSQDLESDEEAGSDKAFNR